MADLQPDPVFAYRVFPLTHVVHKTTYPAISPLRPALAQTGKTILVTGATGGIGYAIARAFGTAGADRVIVVGRNESKAKDSADKLAVESGQSGTAFESRVCQLDDPGSIDALWDGLSGDGIRVDVLVLNAAKTGQLGKMWEFGWTKVWAEFATNVRSVHHFCDRFQSQSLAHGINKYIVNVSTSAIHDWPATKNAPSYGLTKHSAALLLQQLAGETEPPQMQIVSFHPGAVLTPGARAAGLDEISLDWDSEELPASVAVWAATPEAAFLHGRFIWAPWDVEELRRSELRHRIDSDERFLRIGVCGL